MARGAEGGGDFGDEAPAADISGRGAVPCDDGEDAARVNRRGLVGGVAEFNLLAEERLVGVLVVRRSVRGHLRCLRRGRIGDASEARAVREEGLDLVSFERPGALVRRRDAERFGVDVVLEHDLGARARRVGDVNLAEVDGLGPAELRPVAAAVDVDVGLAEPQAEPHEAVGALVHGELRVLGTRARVATHVVSAGSLEGRVPRANTRDAAGVARVGRELAPQIALEVRIATVRRFFLRRFWKK